jgi:hypothetical protein
MLSRTAGFFLIFYTIFFFFSQIGMKVVLFFLDIELDPLFYNVRSCYTMQKSVKGDLTDEQETTGQNSSFRGCTIRGNNRTRMTRTGLN